MLDSVKDIFKKSDYFLLLLLVLLGVISFFAIYSAVYNSVTDTAGEHPFRQLRVFGLGLIAFFVISLIGYKRFVRFALPLYILGCLVLVFVIFKGSVGMGAQRWIYIGPIGGQPSELFKFVWVVMLGWVFADMQAQSMGFLKIFKKLIWLIPPFALVFLQPDLGTSITYIVVWGVVVLFLGVKKEVAAFFIVCCLFATPIVWGNMKDYQKMRIVSFFAPEEHAVGGAYQARQSKIAIGSGGLTGKGYLKGTQSQLRFMPERHTDFIFSVINEEFGFIGGMSIISIFLILLTRIVMVAVAVKEAAGKVICVGVCGFIIFQFYVNVGMTIGIVPVVGVPLPLVSYGGSSLLTFMAMLGLVNSVYINRNVVNN